MKDTKWKIPKTWYDRLADWMGVGFLAASGFYLWANWQASPREIPTPYGFSGQPDAWGDKSSCVVLLVTIRLVIAAIFAWMPGRWSCCWCLGPSWSAWSSFTERNDRAEKTCAVRCPMI